jgi:hypothetical protein
LQLLADAVAAFVEIETEHGVAQCPQCQPATLGVEVDYGAVAPAPATTTEEAAT